MGQLYFLSIIMPVLHRVGKTKNKDKTSTKFKCRVKFETATKWKQRLTNY